MFEKKTIAWIIKEFAPPWQFIGLGYSYGRNKNKSFECSWGYRYKVPHSLPICKATDK